MLTREIRLRLFIKSTTLRCQTSPTYKHVVEVVWIHQTQSFLQILSKHHGHAWAFCLFKHVVVVVVAIFLYKRLQPSDRRARLGVWMLHPHAAGPQAPTPSARGWKRS